MDQNDPLSMKVPKQNTNCGGFCLNSHTPRTSKKTSSDSSKTRGGGPGSSPTTVQGPVGGLLVAAGCWYNQAVAPSRSAIFHFSWKNITWLQKNQLLIDLKMGKMGVCKKKNGHFSGENADQPLAFMGTLFLDKSHKSRGGSSIEIPPKSATHPASPKKVQALCGWFVPEKKLSTLSRSLAMLEFVSGSAILRINQNVPTIDCFPTGTSHHEGNLDVRRVPPGDDRQLAVSNWGSAVKIWNLSVSV